MFRFSLNGRSNERTIVEFYFSLLPTSEQTKEKQISGMFCFVLFFRKKVKMTKIYKGFRLIQHSLMVQFTWEAAISVKKGVFVVETDND